VGTFSLLVLGQWDGLSALGIAGAYALWRRGHLGWGGACLAATAAVAKPHLAIGLAVFIIARRDRRLFLGAAAGLGAVAAASVLAVGPQGFADFLHAAVASTSRWPLRELLGFSGLFGSWLGDGAVAQVLAAVASTAAVAVCAVLGDCWRRRPDRLEPALAGATALSLVAAPHLLGHDLAVLAPVAAWCLAAAWSADARAGGAAARRTGLRVMLLWLGFNVAALADLGNGRSAPPGRLVPWALLLIGLVGLRASRLARPIRAAEGAVLQGSGRGVGGVVE
jgi:hypothetical protein